MVKSGMRKRLEGKIDPLPFNEECILLTCLGRGKITHYAIGEIMRKSGYRIDKETCKIVCKAMAFKGLLTETPGLSKTPYKHQPVETIFFEITDKGESAIGIMMNMRMKLVAPNTLERLNDLMEMSQNTPS